MRGKKRHIKLTTTQREELEQGHRQGKKATFRERCHYLLLSSQGYDVQAIASIYSTSRQTVAAWFDRYEADGIDGLHTKKGQGAKPLLRVENKLEVEAVERLVEQHAQNLGPVLAELHDKYNKPMSKRTLQRFLKKSGTAGNASGAPPPAGRPRRSMTGSAGS
jgi:putative transposase